MLINDAVCSGVADNCNEDIFLYFNIQMLGYFSDTWLDITMCALANASHFLYFFLFYVM